MSNLTLKADETFAAISFDHFMGGTSQEDFVSSNDDAFTLNGLSRNLAQWLRKCNWPHTMTSNIKIHLKVSTSSEENQ